MYDNSRTESSEIDKQVTTSITRGGFNFACISQTDK